MADGPGTDSERAELPATVRYVTRDGYFAGIIAPGPSWAERARERLRELTDEERREAAARYIAARYGMTGRNDG